MKINNLLSYTCVLIHRDFAPLVSRGWGSKGRTTVMVPKYLDYLPREAPMLSEWHTGVSAQLRARGGPYGG